MSPHSIICLILAWTVAVGVFCAAPLAAAAEPARAGEATGVVDPVDARLGPRFTSRAFAITFRPPAGGVASPRITDNPDQVVKYASAEDQWTLLVLRKYLEKPARLFSIDDPVTRADESKTQPGMADELVRQLRINDSAVQILRNDKINLGPHDAAMVVSRSVLGRQATLRQQLILQKNDQLYYIFDFATPSTWTPADKEEDDPAERAAVEIFDAVLESTQVLGYEDIQADLDERQFRLRSLLVGLDRRIRAAAKPEQYFRVLRDGKDIGWTYLTEEVVSRRGEEGILTALLYQAEPEAGVKVDVASEMFASFNATTSTEEWVTINVVERNGKKDHVSEYGSSKRRTGVVRDNDEGQQVGNDPGELARRANYYHLNVRQLGKGGVKPFAQDLPARYVPQAIAGMFPRLVPLREKKTYVLAAWVGSAPALVNRFIDVQGEQAVNFAGHKSAIVVKDRTGLDGDPTLHYFTPDGKYLGHHTATTGVSVVVSDQQTLSRLYPDALIARPHVLDGREGKP